MTDLETISPIDGRYRKYLIGLAPIFSEAGLMRYRVIIEIEYLTALSVTPGVGVRKFSKKEKKLLQDLQNITLANIQEIKKIEVGRGNGGRGIRHDVKAIEYFIKERLQKTSLADILSWIHFGLTSEDVNNLAYGLMLSRACEEHIVPAVQAVYKNLDSWAKQYAHASMLGRTHGQPASPTTFGKEMRVFAERLRRQILALQDFKILVKLNGATGNYNAHVAALPQINWTAFTKKFIQNLAKKHHANFRVNFFTTQIESHDTYAELFDLLRRINTILIACNQDMWRYISDGWLKQRVTEGEVGSSTMPHKINPTDFESSEGNLGLANALLTFFSNKLPISRLQRDLSDATVERNFGVAIAHSVLAYRTILEGFSKIEVDHVRMREELARHPEVIVEGMQTILRREGVIDAYEKFKARTQGRSITMIDIHAFVEGLSVPPRVKKELKNITPEMYIGLAEKLARRGQDRDE